MEEVEKNRPFRLITANFGEHPKLLKEGKLISYVRPHHTSFIDSELSIEVFLRISTDRDERGNKKTTRYKKQAIGVNKVETTNKNLPDDKENNIGIDEVPITAGTVILVAPEEYHNEIRAMLHKQENMCNGHLGEIRGTEHHIDLKDDVSPSRSDQCRYGPNTRVRTNGGG